MQLYAHHMGLQLARYIRYSSDVTLRLRAVYTLKYEYLTLKHVIEQLTTVLTSEPREHFWL